LLALDAFDYALAKDPNRGHNPDHYFSAILTLKITITTPLLLVSRNMHTEAKKVLEEMDLVGIDKQTSSTSQEPELSYLSSN
jgi:hypothetical protein